MVSSWADLSWAVDKAFLIHTDYNMNVFNSYTLRFLADQGAECICLSPELTYKQLTEFGGLSQAELLVHGELPLMQSQYCLIGQTRAPGIPTCSCLAGPGIIHCRTNTDTFFPWRLTATAGNMFSIPAPYA